MLNNEALGESLNLQPFLKDINSIGTKLAQSCGPVAVDNVHCNSASPFVQTGTLLDCDA